MKTRVDLGITHPGPLTNYKYKIGCEREYLFKMIKEIKQITNFKRLSNTITITESRKIKLFLLIDGLTHFCKAFSYLFGDCCL